MIHPSGAECSAEEEYVEDKQIEGEIWKKIPLETKYDYYISNKDRLRNSKTNRIVNGTLTKRYYRVTKLTMSNNKEQHYQFNRLVALAFIGEPPEDKPLVDHKNEIRGDNNLENLEYVNHPENMKRCAHKVSKPVLQYSLNENFIK